MFGRKKWDPQGKHCYVTGGSSGAGLALAILLTRKGAHVSIVARDEEKLQKALQDLESARQNPKQILNYYSYNLHSAGGSKAALDAACVLHGGKAPSAVFTCAGVSKPGFFVEQSERMLIDGMANAYWIQAWTALAATQKMVQDRIQGKIVFVGSTLSLMSMIGYSSYSPGKHAIRGLAEGLRSELILYGIDVHCFFPCTIYSPGYEEENKTKPKITMKLEEADAGLTPEQVAIGILKGVQNGLHQSAVDLITNIFRSSSRGTSPSNNFLKDVLFDILSWIAIPIWRRSLDRSVRGHRQEHEEYLVAQGFYT
ncbi:NAD(P)-binding protein [Ramaria rubella]|nr:NAD(P)-binding protein [Ramaria rubella]